MIDEYLVLRIGVITSVHNEARQVTDAVNPEWISMEVARRSLKFDQSGGFVLVTVEYDFPNGLVILVIIN